MKKPLLFLFVLLSLHQVRAQVCVPGTLTAPKDGYIIPDSATNFSNACPGTWYEQILYIKAPKDTTFVVTTPLSGLVDALIDSFVVNANVVGLPAYLSAESVPAYLPPAPSSPKTNLSRLVIPGDSLACVKISGNVPAGTSAGTLNLQINIRAYLSNLSSPNPTLNALLPFAYPGLRTDTLVGLNYYKIEVFPTPCWPTSVATYQEKNAAWMIHPNPAIDIIRINSEHVLPGSYNFTIRDILGRICYISQQNTAGGYFSTQIALPVLPQGQYSLIIEHASGQWVHKFQITQP